MRKTLTVLTAGVLLATATPKISAQEYPRENPATIYAVNVGINGLIGGIGAAINDKNFFEGFVYGALGGVASTTAKYMVGKNLDYAWPAKILNAVGTSITCNTAIGKKPLETITMDIGPVMLRYTDGSLNADVIPSAVIGIFINTFKGYKFNLEESIRMGTPSFTAPSLDKYAGFCPSNIVLLDELYASDTNTKQHELIHAFQNSNAQTFGALLSNTRFFNEAVRAGEKMHVNFTMDPGILVSSLPQQLLPYLKRPSEIEAYSIAK